jgi:hypothetical protein
MPWRCLGESGFSAELFHLFGGLSIDFWMAEVGRDALAGDASLCSDTLCVAYRNSCEIRTGKLTRKEFDSQVARCGHTGGDRYDARRDGCCLDQESSQLAVLLGLVAAGVNLGSERICIRDGL